MSQVARQQKNNLTHYSDYFSIKNISIRKSIFKSLLAERRQIVILSMNDVRMFIKIYHCRKKRFEYYTVLQGLAILHCLRFSWWLVLLLACSVMIFEG